MPQTEVRVYRKAAKTIPLKGWLEDLEPKANKKCLQRIVLLSQFGSELTHSTRELAAFLRNGIYELRVRIGKVNYRILYFFCGKNVACLSHGLTKEGVVPKADIDLAIDRKSQVEKDPEKYTADASEM